MKILIYLIEFILIKILFNFFKIVGYKNSSNIGFLIGKILGPIFRSKKLVIMFWVITEEFLLNIFILKISEMIS